MQTGPREIDLEAQARAATALVADAAAVEAARAFDGAGIRCVVLRGASVARHLYANSEVRGYVDVDLLVESHLTQQGEAILTQLGFAESVVLGPHAEDRPAWSSTWTRGLSVVDLHWTLAGARASPDEVWSALDAEAVPLDVEGASLRGLSAGATGLVVALHAAHHGLDEKTEDDLRRALARLSPVSWRDAASLAERLVAVPAFGVGLRLLPEGRKMAETLMLQDHPTAEALLRADGATKTALGFEWLAQVPGTSAKSRLLARKVFPEARFMRSWFPPARGGGRLALAVGYLWRPIWLLVHAGPGFVAWRTARRKADGES